MTDTTDLNDDGSDHDRRATGPASGERAMPEVHAAGERRMLEGMLDWYREGVIGKVSGLSDAAASRRLLASESTIIGLVNHLALVEDSWFVRFAGGTPMAEFAAVDWAADPDFEFRTARDESLGTVLARYVAACDRSRAVAAAHALDDEGADRARHVFTLRWVLVHLIEETARHLGHLDVLRELTDGATGE